MRLSNKNFETTNQKKQVTSVSKKKDANLEYNGTLYFLLSLAFVLLVVYNLFELKFETKPTEITGCPFVIEEDLYAFNDIIPIIEKDMPKEAPKKQKKKLVDNLKVVDNDDEITEALDKVITEPETSATPQDNLDDNDLKVEEVPEDVNVPFIGVELKPIFPGCEDKKTETLRMKCFNEQMKKHVGKKFNTDVAERLNLSGKQKIYVEFKIDKTGEITEIKARSPYTSLEKEAKRVISKLPKMTPGMQRDKPVNVIYTLPIIFSLDY